MSELNTGGSKPWGGIYSSSSLHKEGPWKTSSMSALSFGFVATAILISMFLIMAIFEHLFRPTDESSSGVMELRQVHKLIGNVEMVVQESSDFSSVVMPGQQYPTFIAQPAPLPCPREGMFRNIV